MKMPFQSPDAVSQGIEEHQRHKRVIEIEAVLMEHVHFADAGRDGAGDDKTEHQKKGEEVPRPQMKGRAVPHQEKGRNDDRGGGQGIADREHIGLIEKIAQHAHEGVENRCDRHGNGRMLFELCE